MCGLQRPALSAVAPQSTFANAGTLESSGLLVYPYEESVNKSSLKRRAFDFMIGMAASTDLMRLVEFRATDFSKDHATPLMDQFYRGYGARDINALRSVVTGPLLAKLKPHMKPDRKKGKGKKVASRGKASKISRKRSIAKSSSSESHTHPRVGFRPCTITRSEVVQVKTLKGPKDKKTKRAEVVFGQVTCKMDIVLLPWDYGKGREGIELPFVDPPFRVSPGPPRWRRAVDPKGQVRS